jgi:hypothetical protein
MITGRRGDSETVGVSNICVAGSTMFPISREEDLSHAGIHVLIHFGATPIRPVGVRSTEQSATVN